MTTSPHPDLQLLKSHLQQIHDSISFFKPLIARPPIIDSSFDPSDESNEENQWLKQENIPGLKKLKENIKIDLGMLDKFFDDPDCTNLPPLSTNAPYLIAVWNEVLCAPAPIVSVFKTFLINTSASDTDGSRNQRPPGAKVDVVADNGRRWIRVNTAKNSRLLSEFREIDSYLTDSEYESDDDELDDVNRPSLAQSELDNSVLKMGRSLIDAAKLESNPIEGTSETPKVTLRLTRLDPNIVNEDGTEPDPRIAQTLDSLREMGIDVELGERTESELPILTNPITERPPSPSLPFIPTININLDLSILIALISDLTHAPLPTSIEDANKRFLPPQEYREWKKQKKVENSKPRKIKLRPTQSRITEPSGIESDINDLPHYLIKHSRALTNQLLQEMGKGLLPEIHDRLTASNTKEDDPTKLNVTFWTTPEARDRCLRIISKIGGVHEKRRAYALFCYDTSGGGTEIPLDEAKCLYWQDSRFEPNFIPLLPIHLFPTSSIPTSGQDTSTLIPGSSSETRSKLSSFTKSLDKVCADILSQETIPHPRALPDEVVGSSSEIQRAIVTKANPRLTAHTVQSMHWGAHLGWTTLTANRTSVKAILREMKTARTSGRLADSEQSDGNGGNEGESAGWASIWIVDPRSLAEGMSSQPVQA
ncbi:hypothetical protein BYT27DRAFT_7226460 [Phlegmacium glaucopus]|nr:hypothetical protein BYT27DRAFT_7226460 [Phlegmacium glaucopus]